MTNSEIGQLVFVNGSDVITNVYVTIGVEDVPLVQTPIHEYAIQEFKSVLGQPVIGGNPVKKII